MLGFNMLTTFVLLSCVVAVCMAELSPKEEVFADEWTQHELERKVYDNKVKLDETAPKEDGRTNDAIVALAGDIDALELADPIKSAEIAESIESALTGYDVVIGDPLNVVNSGTVKDKGVKKQIFQYDPNDQRSLLQTSVQTGCSSTGDSTVISTVGKYRKQVDKEAEVSGSVSGSGFGVSASFAFSASTSSTEVEDFITQKHGSLTIFTMTCSLRHLDVGNTDVGLPPFKWKFANFITDTLGEVPTGNAPESIRAQKLKFKSLLTNYGTHYIYQATIGARVTTTKFLSQSMTSTMSQSTMKACASASASVDYMAVSAEVSASGCSASDKSKFNSRDQGVTKTVKNSYGTTKVAGDGSKFNMDQMKEPRPIKFKLAPIVDLFTPKALMYGIPEKFGKAVDTDGKKRKALSKRILSWLKPMFKRDNFEKNYCEAFKTELPDCGKKVSKQRGCGYTGSCGAFQKCVNTNTAPYFQCNSIRTKWYCAVHRDGGIRATTFNLREAQSVLGWGSKSNIQAIIPMTGRTSGDPHTLAKSWGRGSMWWREWSDIRALQRVCATAGAAGPQQATVKWYCAVHKNEGVRATTYNLRNAQRTLGYGSKHSVQAIIPMFGRAPGDPHILAKSWDGGSMWWSGYSDIHALQRVCSYVSPPKQG